MRAGSGYGGRLWHLQKSENWMGFLLHGFPVFVFPIQIY